MDQPIPEDLRELCEEAGGTSLLAGNLNVYPLDAAAPDELSVATASDPLRSWDWPVPQQPSARP